MARLPADACPYPRPFPDGFAECPLYDGERYVPADSKESPLGTIWICRHLVTRPFNLDGVEHHYGACRFGGRGARRRLAVVTRIKRLVAAP